MRIYNPLKSFMFKVDEDSGVDAGTQILNQVNAEENYFWAISPIQFQTPKERVSYYQSLGRKFKLD